MMSHRWTKVSILGTVIDDQLCFRLADPGKRHQFRKIRLINIDKTGYFVIGAGASLCGRFLSFAGNCDLFPVCQKTRLINCGSIGAYGSDLRQHLRHHKHGHPRVNDKLPGALRHRRYRLYTPQCQSPSSQKRMSLRQKAVTHLPSRMPIPCAFPEASVPVLR